MNPSNTSFQRNGEAQALSRYQLSPVSNLSYGLILLVSLQRQRRAMLLNWYHQHPMAGMLLAAERRALTHCRESSGLGERVVGNSET